MLEKLRRIRNIGLFTLALCVSTAISTSTNPKSFGTVENGKMRCYLTRTIKTNDRTLGTLVIPGATSPILRTMEPPYRIRKPRSIPVGTYVVEVLRSSPTAQPRLHLVSVVGFSNVYIEVGNFPTDTRGCVLVGLSVQDGELRDSRKAYQALLDSLGSSKDFILVILDEQPASKPTNNQGRSDAQSLVYFLPTRQD